MLLYNFVRRIPSLPSNCSLFLEEVVEIHSLWEAPTPSADNDLWAASTTDPDVPSVAKPPGYISAAVQMNNKPIDPEGEKSDVGVSALATAELIEMQIWVSCIPSTCRDTGILYVNR